MSLFQNSLTDMVEGIEMELKTLNSKMDKIIEVLLRVEKELRWRNEGVSRRH